MVEKLICSKPRNTYQEKRFRFLEKNLLSNDLYGLEIGACNLPTVPSHFGKCYYADFRTADEMSAMWGLDRQYVCDVDYIINRSFTLPYQIHDKFDYVIACHVIEHVPDPIGYIQELGDILKPGGIIFLAIPDKRMTPDKNRPSTTIDHLLMDFHDKCRYPTIEHIMCMHRHWLELETGAPLPIAEVYDYAKTFYASGEADVHCHVWDDKIFHQQFKELSAVGLLGKLEMTAFEYTPHEFNEFVAVFTKF